MDFVDKTTREQAEARGREKAVEYIAEEIEKFRRPFPSEEYLITFVFLEAMLNSAREAAQAPEL